MTQNVKADFFFFVNEQNITLNCVKVFEVAMLP